MRDLDSLEMTERAVLFGSIHNAAMRSSLIAQGSEKWFLAENHRRLFLALAACVEKRESVDHLSIMRSARRNENASFGDVVLEPDWLLTGFSEVKGMTLESFVDTHMPVLRLAYQSRRLYEFFATGLERSIDAAPVEMLSWAMMELSGISSEGQAASAMLIADALMEQLDQPADADSVTAVLGPLTQIPFLDKIGLRLRPMEPITIAGRPAEGKTVIATQMAIGASADCSGLVIPVEDGEDVWLERYSRMTMGLSLDNLRLSDRSTDFDHRRFSDYVSMTRDRRLYIARKPQGMRTFDIIALVQHLKSHDPKLGFVVIDQMYRIADYNRRENRGETETAAITRSVLRIVDACNMLKVVPIMLQHVAKDILGDPQIKDISDSYIFERVSRKIILVSRPNKGSANDNIARINVAKWTMEGEKQSDVSFDGERMRIDGFVDPMTRASGLAL